jgi:hypothetical protein
MAKKKRPVHFEVPRDEEGHFLPKELWTKKEIREYERLKKQGLLKKNPMRRTKMKGSSRAKDLYIQPRGDDGSFLPRSEWTPSERRLAKRAEEEGLTIAAQMPRDSKGRFISPTGKSKKKKKGHAAPPSEYPAMVPVHPGPGDPYGMHQGNVTVVYPPYPPQPVPVVSQPAQVQAPQPIIVQMPQAALDQDDRVRLTARRRRHEDGDVDEEYEVLCDPCQAKLIQGQGDLLEGQRILKKGVEACEECVVQYPDDDERQLAFPYMGSRLRRNPRRRYPMYYVDRTFGERVGDALDVLRRKPLLALVAVGAVALIGYALYRLIRSFNLSSMRSAGVDIANGTIYFPGEQPYVITDEDKLWMARMIFGEVNRDPSAWSRPDVQRGGGAVLWAMANHYITVGQKRQLYPTLASFLQGYSQPINPRWVDPNGERCRRSPAMCTADRIAFRRTLRAKTWGEFPVALQNLVLSFAAGRVPNPVGTRTDFRMAGTGFNPADPLNVEDNIFGTAPNARRRPAQQVA